MQEKENGTWTSIGITRHEILNDSDLHWTGLFKFNLTIYVHFDSWRVNSLDFLKFPVLYYLAVRCSDNPQTLTLEHYNLETHFSLIFNYTFQ